MRGARATGRTRRAAALVWAAVAALGAFGCSPSEGEPSAEIEEEASGSVLVQTERIERGSVAEFVFAIGALEFDATRIHTVPFLGSGQVTEVAVVAGEAVHRGDFIARLGGLPAAGLEAQRARTNSDYARRELQRVTRLRAEHLATNAELEIAQKALVDAEAELGSLGGSGSGKGGRELTAPADGVIAEIKVAPGDLVAAGQTAFTLAPPDALVVRVGFDPEDAARLRAGLRAEVSPLFAREGARPVTAELAQLHAVVDPQTQRVEAVIRIPGGASGVFAGERVRVAVAPESSADALLVPRAAVTDREGEEGVFVIADEKAHWHPLEVGVRGELQLEAAAGVEAGDEVVVAGHSSLEDGSRVRLDAPDAPDVAGGPHGEAAEPPAPGAPAQAAEPSVRDGASEDKGADKGKE